MGVGSFFASFVSGVAGGSVGGLSMSAANRRKNEKSTASVQSSPSNDVDRLSIYLNGEFQRIQTNGSQSSDPEIERPLDTIDVTDTVGSLTTLDKNIRIVDTKVRSMDSTLRNTVSLMEYNKRLLEKTVSTMNDIKSQSNYKRFSDLENKLEDRKEPYLDDATLKVLEKRISDDLTKKFGGGGSAGAGIGGAIAGAELGAIAFGGGVATAGAFDLGAVLLGGLGLAAAGAGLGLAGYTAYKDLQHPVVQSFLRKVGVGLEGISKTRLNDDMPQAKISNRPFVSASGSAHAKGLGGGSIATLTQNAFGVQPGYGEESGPIGAHIVDPKTGKFKPAPGFETLPWYGDADAFRDPIKPYTGKDLAVGQFPPLPGFEKLPLISDKLIAMGYAGGSKGWGNGANLVGGNGYIRSNGSFGSSSAHGSAQLDREIFTLVASGQPGISTGALGDVRLNGSSHKIDVHGVLKNGASASGAASLEGSQLKKMSASGIANAGNEVMAGSQSMMVRLESIMGTLHDGVRGSGTASLINKNALLANGSTGRSTNAQGGASLNGEWYTAKKQGDEITSQLRKSYQQMIQLYTNAGKMDKANEIKKKLDALNDPGLGLDTEGPSYDAPQGGSFLPMTYKQYTDNVTSSGDKSYAANIKKVNDSKLDNRNPDVVADVNRFEVNAKYLKQTGLVSFEAYSDTLYYVHSKQDLVLRAPNITLIGNVKNVAEDGSTIGSGTNGITKTSWEQPGSTLSLGTGGQDATNGPGGGLRRSAGGNGGWTKTPPQTGSWLPPNTFTPVSAATVPNLGGGTKAQQAYAFFKSKGWSDVQAAGIVGNLMHESSLKTSIVGDGGEAIGLAQWHPDRQRNFAKLYGHTVSQGTYEEQLAFVQWELEHTHKNAGNALKGSKTVEDATAMVQKYYEAPASLTASIASRTKNAQNVMNAGSTDTTVSYNDPGSGLGVKIGVTSGWVNPAVTAKLASNATWKNARNGVMPLPAPAPLQATNASGGQYMLGDSIGVGMAQAGHMKSFAKVGARTDEVLGQMANVPDGSNVMISSGTNDAVAGRVTLQKSVDEVLAYAKSHKINVTWIGPPPVKTKWNDQSVKLDSWMSSYLNGKTKYVSLQNDTVGSLKRSSDGIHFTGNGYASLYGMVQSSEIQSQKKSLLAQGTGVAGKMANNTSKPTSPTKTWQTQALEKAAELRKQSKTASNVTINAPKVPQSQIRDTTPNTHDGVNMSAGSLPNYAGTILA